MSPLVESAVVLLLVWFVLRRIKEQKLNPTGLPFPPGPPQLPILGNVFNHPISKPMPWAEYAALAQKYGDVMYFNVLGQPIIVLSSTKAANDLFDKRSTKYSSRMKTTMIHDLLDLKWSFASMPYGDRWRKTRRIFHKYFHVDVVNKYQDVQIKGAQTLMRRLKESPNDFFEHIRITFAASIMKIIYDINVKDANDPYIHMAEKGLEGFNIVAQPGRFLADSFPIMKYIPAWFPGAYFRILADESKYCLQQARDVPYRYAKAQVRAGTAGPSMVASMVEKLDDTSDNNEYDIACRDAAGVAYLGGADTTMSAVQSLFLAMVLYPEVQKKAQEELDAIVGRDRMPTFEDRPSLPYLEAIICESLRWHMVIPIGVPHYTTEDDEYRGYYIPKGTVVIGNAWAILHDPARYPEPEEFRPERFLTKDGQFNSNVEDPDIACFGYGRRICPGMHLARNSMFILIASILHTFDITPALDENGSPVKVDPGVTSGLISYPIPYRCSIKPRSPSAEALITKDASL